MPTSTQPPPPTETPDLCADATSLGARHKFTYAEIVPCLDGPEKVYQFMLNNLAWDPGWDGSQYGGNAYSPASEVYTNGADDCDGLAEFGACVLSQHGWESYNLAISIIGPQGIVSHHSEGAMEQSYHHSCRLILFFFSCRDPFETAHLPNSLVQRRVRSECPVEPGPGAYSFNHRSSHP
jgi:hypothetical protein